MISKGFLENWQTGITEAAMERPSPNKTVLAALMLAREVDKFVDDTGADERVREALQHFYDVYVEEYDAGASGDMPADFWLADC